MRSISPGGTERSLWLNCQIRRGETVWSFRLSRNKVVIGSSIFIWPSSTQTAGFTDQSSEPEVWGWIGDPSGNHSDPSKKCLPVRRKQASLRRDTGVDRGMPSSGRIDVCYFGSGMGSRIAMALGKAPLKNNKTRTQIAQHLIRGFDREFFERINGLCISRLQFTKPFSERSELCSLVCLG